MKTTNSTQGGEPKTPRRRAPARTVAEIVPANPTPAGAPPSLEMTSGQKLPERPSPPPAPQRTAAKKDMIDPAVSTREKIALLAYSYWEARGRQGGTPEEDWFRAERVILGNSAGRTQ